MKKLFFCLRWVYLVLLMSSLFACESMGDIAEILLGVSQGVSDGLNSAYSGSSSSSSSGSSSGSSSSSSSNNTYYVVLHNYSSVTVTAYGDGKTYKIPPNTTITHYTRYSEVDWDYEPGYLNSYTKGGVLTFYD